MKFIVILQKEKKDDLLEILLNIFFCTKSFFSRFFELKTIENSSISLLLLFFTLKARVEYFRDQKEILQLMIISDFSSSCYFVVGF